MKDRESQGRVDWDYQGVIRDTVYVLSSDNQEDLKERVVYETGQYFSEKNIPEILFFEKSTPGLGKIFSNKKFVQDNYDYLDILNLIMNNG